MRESRDAESHHGKELIAVYGTLKRGLNNAHWLNDADFIGRDRLRSITLYDLGPYPAALEELSEGVEVEVFRVNERQLRAVDRLEGYHAMAPETGLYTRRKMTTRHGRAWVYLYNHSVDGCVAVRRGGWPL